MQSIIKQHGLAKGYIDRNHNMTAVPNFTLPNLDIPSGNAAAPAVSSTGHRVEASPIASSDKPGLSGQNRGKEFSDLVNSPNVKNKTGKDGSFDGPGQSRAKPTEDYAEISADEDIANNPVQTLDSRSEKLSNETVIKAVTGYLRTASADAVGDQASRDILSRIELTRSPQSGVATEGEAIPARKDALSASVMKLVGGLTTENTYSAASSTADPAKQAKATTPANESGLNASMSLRAANILDSSAARGLPPVAEADELAAQQIRQVQSLASDPLTGSARAGAGSKLDTVAANIIAEAEFAALSGKEVPPSGKPLPAELPQPSPQIATGISLRPEPETRLAESSRLGPTIGDLLSKESTGRFEINKVKLVNSRPGVSELVGKLVNQAQFVPISESAANPQTPGSDTQPTGLLAQHQSGVDRSASASSINQVSGFDVKNNLMLQLQSGAQEISAQLGSRIRWMGNLNLSSAELKLYPAELGTLEILITAEDDQARVNFVTSTSAAKEMIEASLPRLRELLGQSGLLLEQGDVTHRDLNQNSSKSEVPAIERPTAESPEAGSLEQAMPMYQRSASDHRLDHFA